MSCLRFTCLLAVLSVFLSSTARAFVVVKQRPLASNAAKQLRHDAPSLRRTRWLLLSATSEDNEQTSDEIDEERPAESQSSSLPKQPQQTSSAEERQLDPLIASLTRNDRPSTNTGGADTKSIKAPLFGEIPVDGSLVVLVPALIIGLVGFVMSINIAVNSQDKIVDSLNQLSEDVTAAALAKTNSAAPLNDESCRGICTNDQDLEGLKAFMESLKK